jgi:hypothetical protein
MENKMMKKMMMINNKMLINKSKSKAQTKTKIKKMRIWINNNNNKKKSKSKNKSNQRKEQKEKLHQQNLLTKKLLPLKNQLLKNQ